MKYLLYDVSHTTTSEYSDPVSVAHHLLHLAPRQLPRQLWLDHSLSIDPSPTSVSSHDDYFGNLAHLLTLEGAHQRFSVTFRSRVALAPPFVPDAAETPAWEIVRGMCRGDHSARALEANEFSHDSAAAPLHKDFTAYATESFPANRPLLDALLDLNRRIHEDFRFDPKATNVNTPLEIFFRQRRGVCQDFAHFALACLRSLGLPARYVSGYIETDPPPGQPKLRGADASHAWISAFCPGLGWIDLDPTNNCLPKLRHVTVAWGRDYHDVSPVRGVLIGGGDHELTVAVDVTAQGTLEA
jgi:transglutaminase-like putative cysteine protease